MATDFAVCEAGVTRGILLDIAGVLYQGSAPLPGAAQAVSTLRDAGLPVRFLTNSTRRPKRVIHQKLKGFGIDAEADEILTPAAAACAWLRANGLVPHLLIHPDLEEDFATCPESGSVAVVVGDAGPYFNYERLNAAFRQIDKGAPFLALASNRKFLDADGELSLDAGAFVRALEYSSGKNAELFGKPSPTFFGSAAQSMGQALADLTMIGDDAESDVAGALKAGVGNAILVRSGKYQAGDEIRYDPKPSETVEGISEAVELVVSGQH
ncbi:TIGR01458 family HAD-type hydrolase [Ruegeria sp. ANG-S4]|uniref:TIGR01458 family HAD-type hydrolase n=1 Tax=Ruegeria sp. ANG-S4 TaxID=1577904 RepID=UPI0006903AB5|nr:TIGR01458 family HAD-type hydrolase [Ruegeria sp. ANG-S4]